MFRSAVGKRFQLRFALLIVGHVLGEHGVKSGAVVKVEKMRRFVQRHVADTGGRRFEQIEAHVDMILLHAKIFFSFVCISSLSASSIWS